MSVKMIMAVFSIFILGTLLSCLCSGVWFGSDEVDIVNALASFNTMSVQAGGVWNAPKTLTTYWDAAVTMFTWGYPFLDYDWLILVKIPLWIVSVGAAWGFLQLFVSIIQGLFSMFRNLITGGS